VHPGYGQILECDPPFRRPTHWEAVQSGESQIILTTHSPYFLDLLPLQTILQVERDKKGNPVFWRPADNKEVRDWAKDFAPGRLYTTGRLSRGKKR